MEARLFYSTPLLVSTETPFVDPKGICNDIFSLYYHDYIDMLNEMKATKTVNNLSGAFIPAAVNFVFNYIAEWCNRMKKDITHYPVTLENVTWLLLSTELTKTFTKEFGFKNILPLLFNETKPAYYIDAVNTAISENEAASSMVNDMDATILAILNDFPEKLEEFKNGKSTLSNFFVGETIRRTKNRSPELRVRVNELLLTL